MNPLAPSLHLETSARAQGIAGRKPNWWLQEPLDVTAPPDVKHVARRTSVPTREPEYATDGVGLRGTNGPLQPGGFCMAMGRRWGSALKACYL